jgi:hypothetical protein
MKKYRVVRTIEYVGPREWLDRVLARSFATSQPKMFAHGAHIVELSCSTFQSLETPNGNDHNTKPDADGPNYYAVDEHPTDATTDSTTVVPPTPVSPPSRGERSGENQ